MVRPRLWDADVVDVRPPSMPSGEFFPGPGVPPGRPGGETAHAGTPRSATPPAATPNESPLDGSVADASVPGVQGQSQDRVSWRVSRGLAWSRAGGAVAAMLLALAIGHRDRGALFMLGLATIVLAILAFRDFLAPVRVEADAAGVTVVSGFADRRLLAWSQIERIRVDDRLRLGRQVRSLEIDAGDGLFLFGQMELGVPCDEVANQLEYLRNRYAR